MLITGVSSAYWFCITFSRDMSGEYGMGGKDIQEEQLPGFLWKSGAFEVTKVKWMWSEWIWVWSRHDGPCGSASCAQPCVCHHQRTTPGCCLVKILDLSQGEGCAVCTYPWAMRHHPLCTVPFLPCFLHVYNLGHNILLNLLVLQCELAHLCLATFSSKFLFSCIVSLCLKQILSYVS